MIVSRAVAPEGVLDIFAAAGLDKPDVSILSEEFLAEVRGMRRRNLAVELLQKRYGGVGLIAVGAIVNLVWPDSPARLSVSPLRGGGSLGASFGF